MLNQRFALILPLVMGCVVAQEAKNLFEKAPPDIDQALRARVTKFYDAFVKGKFRLADALVAEDSKDTFFAMEKKKYDGCELGNITYSQNFTRALAVTSCDTNYFMMGRQFPIKLPITSQWKVEGGEWMWYVIPVSERTMMDTPIGPVRVPSPDDPTQRPAAPKRQDTSVVVAELSSGVKVDRDQLEINPTKAGSDKVTVTNSMPGAVTVVAENGGVAGLKIEPAKADLGSGENKTFTFTFDPKDPAILCKECLAHPQSREAGKVTLRISPTGQTFPIQVNFITPPPSSK